MCECCVSSAKEESSHPRVALSTQTWSLAATPKSLARWYGSQSTYSSVVTAFRVTVSMCWYIVLACVGTVLACVGKVLACVGVGWIWTRYRYRLDEGDSGTGGREVV